MRHILLRAASLALILVCLFPLAVLAETAGEDSGAVAFPAAHADWESWHMTYLRQQGLVTENPVGTDVTVPWLNDLLNAAACQLASAFGAETPNYRPYVSGAFVDYDSLAAGLAAFELHMEQLNPYATAPNYHLQHIKQVDADEGDICFNDFLNFVAILHKTESYIAQFDPEWYAIKGADYLSESYDPARLGKPSEEIDLAVDYDFARLAEVTGDLINVDRRRTLSAIFAQVTQDAQTDLDKHVALLEFLGRAGFHGPLQPLREDGRMVEDPLILLELGEMLCGHVARVACDLFSAGDYPSRLVQAGGHVFAEVYYAQDWHYFDADTNIFSPVMVEERIPSVVELSASPHLVDITGNWWPVSSLAFSMEGPFAEYHSNSYFGQDAYESQPCYMVKTATAQMELNDFFGWDSIAFVSDSQRQLHSDLPLYTTPNAPALTDIQYDNEQGLYTLSWETPAVQKGELAGYLVYVSEESRGWDWNTFYGDKSLLSYRSREGYRPEEILFKSQLPPSEVALLPLGWEATTVDIPIAQGQTLYVSLVAFDAHGQQVGNQLYPPSNEFVLTA